MTDLIVAVTLEGVQVHPERAGEEHWVLWHNGQFAAQIVQTHLADIAAVDHNAPVVALNDAEQSQCQRTLPCNQTFWHSALRNPIMD